MDKEWQHLINAIYSLNGFSWTDAVSILSLIASWITIAFLLRDKLALERPYVQVSFELIRSNLACVVIRNTGTVPVSLCSIQFGQEFIKQLPDSDEKRLFENGISDMHIYPGKSWVMCLGVIVPDILKYQNTVLIVNYTYKRLGRRKEYSEDTSIDFKQYSKCMVYISEIDELREVNKKMASDIKDMKETLAEIKAVVISYSNLEDRSTHSIIAVYEVKKQSEDLDE